MPARMRVFQRLHAPNVVMKNFLGKGILGYKELSREKLSCLVSKPETVMIESENVLRKFSLDIAPIWELLFNGCRCLLNLYELFLILPYAFMQFFNVIGQLKIL